MSGEDYDEYVHEDEDEEDADEELRAFEAQKSQIVLLIDASHRMFETFIPAQVSCLLPACMAWVLVIVPCRRETEKALQPAAILPMLWMSSGPS